ncbi:MAG: hypothetical protein ACRDUY_08925 [Nitriliruptorales bacterium]
MSIDLTEEQRQDVLKGEPVRVSVPDLGRDVVLLSADLFEEIREILQDEREQAAFRAFARKQAARLARENPY